MVEGSNTDAASGSSAMALALLVALTLALTAVVAAACEADPGRGGQEGPVAGDGAWIELAAVPQTGPAPLAVRFRADLVATDDDGLRCPGVAWLFGDGPAIIEEGRCPEGPLRVFETVHVYDAPGAYNASLRLIGAGLSSAPVQIVVAGPTPTVGAAARMGFPPIIVVATADPGTMVTAAAGAVEPVATGARDALASGATVDSGRARATAERGAPSATDGLGSDRATAEPGSVRTTAEPGRAHATSEPGQVRATSDRASSGATAERSSAFATGSAGPAGLPADLYYLDGAGRLVLRRARGGVEFLTPTDAPVTSYDVSPAGDVAYVVGVRLLLLREATGAQPLSLSDRVAGAPLWSADGRRLAWPENDVRVYDMTDGRRRPLSVVGQPLAWSRDGDRLALALGDGQPALATGINAALRGAAAVTVQHLPIGEVAQASWLPDRNVLVLVGPGLRLLGTDDALQLVTLLPAPAAVRYPFVGRGLALTALVERAGAWTPERVDLNAAQLTLAPAGPALPARTVTAGAGFAWAPDGRTAALAGPAGVELVDTVTGARIPLESSPASRPLFRPH